MMCNCKPEIKSGDKANEYCHSIVHEVLALEKLVGNDESFDDDLEDYLRRLWTELAESVGEEPARYEPSVVDYVNLHFLEFTTWANGAMQRTSGAWSVPACLERTADLMSPLFAATRTSLSCQVHWGSEFAKALALRAEHSGCA